MAALAVKAKRVGKDLHLLFDGAPSAQVVLIGYHEVASENHTPLLGRMPEGSLRGYVVMAASAAGLDTSALPEGGELAELSLFDDSHQNAGALTALAPLTAGPGAVVAALGGLAAAAGGGGGGAGANPPARTPEEALKLLQAAASNNTAKGLTASVDQSAGVTGVSDANLAAINDVLNTQDVTDTRLPSKAEVQRIVDAYAKVFKAADHIDGNMTDSTAPTAEDYSMLTVSWGLTTQSSALVKMLSDVVDGKGPSDVDTVAKLQALADAVKAVMGYTTRGVDAPTVAQISSLLAGQTDPVAVTDDALTAVQKNPGQQHRQQWHDSEPKRVAGHRQGGDGRLHHVAGPHHQICPIPTARPRWLSDAGGLRDSGSRRCQREQPIGLEECIGHGYRRRHGRLYPGPIAKSHRRLQRHIGRGQWSRA